MTMSNHVSPHRTTVSAADGLRAALSRATSAFALSRAGAPMRTAPTVAAASATAIAPARATTTAGPNAWEQRLRTVAKAVETDPRCKGKASVALAILSDKALDGLSAGAVIKALGTAPAPADAGAEQRCAVTLALLADGAPAAAAGRAGKSVHALPAPAKAAPAQARSARLAPAAKTQPATAAETANARPQGHDWAAIHAEMAWRTGRSSDVPADPQADNHGWAGIHAAIRERRAR